MSKEKSENRRQVARWQIAKEAQVRLEGAQECADCRINDLSFRGLQLVLRIKVPMDTFLKLQVYLSADCVLEVEAWAAWHKTIDGHNIYGMYFTKIKDPDKEKLYQFIRRNFPQVMYQQWWRGTKPREEEGGETMQMGRSDDRRIFERFKVGLPLRYLDLKTNEEGMALAVDIGAKGVGILGPKAFSPHEPLEMWLELTDKGGPVYLRGQVVWSDKAEEGKFKTGICLEKADLMGLSRVLRTG